MSKIKEKSQERFCRGLIAALAFKLLEPNRCKLEVQNVIDRINELLQELRAEGLMGETSEDAIAIAQEYLDDLALALKAAFENPALETCDLRARRTADETNGRLLLIQRTKVTSFEATAIALRQERGLPSPLTHCIAIRMHTHPPHPLDLCQCGNVRPLSPKRHTRPPGG